MGPALALAVAALSGFIGLSYEILWYRLFAFAAGGTPQSFGLLLGFYLYGLAVGGVIARRLCRKQGSSSAHHLLIKLATLVLVADVVGYLVVPALAWSCHRGFCPAALPAVAVSTAFLGATLPVISEVAIPPDWLAGLRLSIIYFANIAGSVAGSLLTGYVLMDRWPASTVAVLLALLGLLLAGILMRAGGRPRVALSPLLLGGSLCLWVTPGLYNQLYEKLLFKEHFRPEMRLAQTLENRVGVINITPSGRVFGGGVYDGFARVDLVADPNQLIRAVAIPAFHPRPRRVLMIGMSMGAWAQVLANLPGVDELRIVEINPGYLSLIPRYPHVASVLRNPKVRIDIDDGRRWLAHHPAERFDLIVANITFHWREHATNLLSTEFLELVRQHLTPDGVYYYNTTRSAEVMKTGFTAFPYGLRFGSFIAVSGSPLRFDHEGWKNALTELTIDGHRVFDPADSAHARRLAEILAIGTTADTAQVPMLEWRESVLQHVDGARVITDDNMASEWDYPAVGAWDP
jgi:MFS family permease